MEKNGTRRSGTATADKHSQAQAGDVWAPQGQGRGQPPVIIVQTRALGPHAARVPLWVFIFVALALVGMGLMPGWVGVVWILASLLILARLRHS